MITARKNAILRLVPLSLTILASFVMVSGAFAATQPKPGEQVILDGDYYYCPAEYHSCSWSGTVAYFPPDPFDYGAACDHDYLLWNSSTQSFDTSSCYGNCDANNPDPSCYVGCMDHYSSCLRTAFSLGPRRVSLSSQSPHMTPNFAGNVFRSCLANRVPPAFATQYQQCLDEGKTAYECCIELAGSFP